jgi:two-component system, sensor histidine kinase RegB
MSAHAPTRVAPVEIHWLVRLRWAAVAALSASVLAVRFVLHAPVPEGPVAAIFGALVVANVVLLRALRSGRTISDRAIALNLLIDTAAITALLLWTGGAMNPFTTLYLLHVALAAVLVSRRLSLTVAVGSVGAFGALLVLRPEAVHVWHAPGMFLLHVRGMWLAFALTAGCLWYFTDRVNASLRHREAELTEARLDAERAERLAALGALAAGTAHELNTPLGTMAIMASELSEQLADRPEARAQADHIRAEIRRCAAILSKMRSHEQSPEEPVTLDVGAWVTEVLASSPEHAAVPLAVSAEAAGARVSLRPETLRQALVSLLDNARHATAGASGDAVTVRVDALDGAVAITVEDRGVGIDPALLPRLGQPFVTTREPGEGMGLGLYLVRAAAAQHKGALSLASEGGVTRATLTLPTLQ